MSSCGDPFCTCCRRAYSLGVLDGARRGYELGFRDGHRDGYVTGYLDGYKKKPPLAPFKVEIESCLPKVEPLPVLESRENPLGQVIEQMTKFDANQDIGLRGYREEETFPFLKEDF